MQPLLSMDEIRILKVSRLDHARVAMGQGDLETILINLMQNARDSIVDHGSGSRTIALSCIAERDSVTIGVEDTGGGVPSEIGPHIFDPWFTTKPADKGTGIGLHAVRAMVTLHGGTVAFHNRDQGACFEIRMPIASSAEYRYEEPERIAA